MAGAKAVIEDDRPGAVLLQPAVDLPDRFLALCLVGLDRLLLVHLLELGGAVIGVIALRAAGVMLVEIGVGSSTPDPDKLAPTMKSLRAILGNQLAVSTASSSPSM